MMIIICLSSFWMVHSTWYKGKISITLFSTHKSPVRVAIYTFIVPNCQSPVSLTAWPTLSLASLNITGLSIHFWNCDNAVAIECGWILPFLPSSSPSNQLLCINHMLFIVRLFYGRGGQVVVIRLLGLIKLRILVWCLMILCCGSIIFGP